MSETVYRQHYAGADWMASNFNGEMSPFGRRIADLVGEVYRGIYHINTNSMFKAAWNDEHFIKFKVYDTPSTFDSDTLTRLVLLAHERCVRVEIKGAKKGYLWLMFGNRSREAKDIYHWHPTLEEAVQFLPLHNPGDAASKIVHGVREQIGGAE